VSQQYEVCVFGAGPAGVATALRLADLGLSVVACDRRSDKHAWGGESFTGAIREPLLALGLWDDFLAAGHVAGYEQRTMWGEVGVADSLFNPHGATWHVDRGRFDKDLRMALRRSAVSIVGYSSLDVLRRDGGLWRIGLDQRPEILASYVVDATGRARAVARALGVRPRIYDRLVALTAQVPRNRAFDRTMIIQSMANGWWYAAPVPRGHVLAYFTDSDLAPREWTRRMRMFAANSVFTEVPEGDGWLSVGDACAAHDPLCGWGVHRALDNGRRAAEAVCAYIRNADASKLALYGRHCRDQFDAYLEGLSERYSYERRWREFEFWRRRLRVPAVPSNKTEPANEIEHAIAAAS